MKELKSSKEEIGREKPQEYWGRLSPQGSTGAAERLG